MCGAEDVEVGTRCVAAALRNVDAATWQRLRDAWSAGAHRDLFVAPS